MSRKLRKDNARMVRMGRKADRLLRGHHLRWSRSLMAVLEWGEPIRVSQVPWSCV